MKNIYRLGLSMILTATLAAAAATPASFAASGPSIGVASWYGPGFHGRRTANGERYDMHKMTAAHRSLRFGTKVKVTNRNNGKAVIVRINDRGPFTGGRIIDLSKGAAAAIGMVNRGTARVSVEVLG